MSISTLSASVYTDLHGLDQLKHKLKDDSLDDLRVVAQQFEAIFIQQMLKTMREASLSEGVFDSNASDFYVNMMDKQLSLNLSAGKGIGLADVIVQQLSNRLNLKPKEEAQQVDSMNLPQDANTSLLTDTQPQIRKNDDDAKLDGAGISANPNNDSMNESINDSSLEILEHSSFLNSANTENITDPETFIKNLWPLAVNAAREIGVTPQVLIAKAALETAWGQYIVKDESGKSSHNLFNIKAGSAWQGDTVTIATTELKDGAAVKVYAAFRVYDSYNSSFQDYVALAKHNTREQQVIANSTNAGDFTFLLQNSAYTIDPDYSAKILQIANGKNMLHVSADLTTNASDFHFKL